MENIIAALIISCSQLNVAGITNASDDAVIKARQKCVQRVTECAKKKTPLVSPMTVGESVLDCGKEYY